MLKMLWLTSTQTYTYLLRLSKCEMEFLSVYTPSEEEKKDPKLLAKNVRAVIWPSKYFNKIFFIINWCCVCSFSTKYF